MHGLDWVDLVIVIWGDAVLLIYGFLLFLALCLCRRQACWDRMAGVLRGVSLFLSAGTSTGMLHLEPRSTGDQKKDELIVSKSAELAEKRCREYARRVFAGGAPWLVLLIVPALLAKHLDWSKNGPLEQHEFLVFGHQSLNLMNITFAVLCMISKKQPVPGVRRGLHILIGARLVATTLLYKDSFHMMLDRSFILSARAVSAIVLGDARVTMLVNCVYAAVACMVWASFLRQDVSIEEMFGGGTMYMVTVQETCFVVMLTIVGAFSELRMQSEARATVEARASLDFQSAVHNLLMTIYDVVLELDEHLNLVDDSESLAGILLMGRNCNLKGSSIKNCMFEKEDIDHFEEHVKQAHSNDLQSTAIPIRLRMRDSSGRAVPVELLHSQFTDLICNVRYLVGIRELTESINLSSVDKFDQELTASIPRVVGASTTRLSRGTPAKLQRQALSRVSIPETEILWSRNVSLSSSLLHPDFHETTSDVRKASLVQMLARWNLEGSRSWCCSYHVVMYEAMSILKTLQRVPCCSIHNLYKDWQCPECKMMDIDAEMAGFEAEDGCCSRCPPSVFRSWR